MIGIEEFWADAKNELSKVMQAISFEVWIGKLEPVCFIDDKFVLCSSTLSVKKTVDERYLDTITEVVNKLNNTITNVEIILPAKKEEYIEKQTDFLPGKGLVVENKEIKNQKKENNPFFEKYTFENFVEGKSNNYALAAAKTVASNPGGQYNPLFIYAGVGLGKTHLLHAIGNYIYKNSPKTNVVYVTPEQMVNEFVSLSLSKNNEDNNKFREKYHNCDVLMVDDVQFLEKRERTQEAFFNIFNDLYQTNKQIIITSDRSPKELGTMSDVQERLISRFAWGLTVDIQVPDTETRIAILKTKAAQEKFNLSDEVASFIAENSTSNIREMEGLLNKIVFFSSLTNHPINTKELAYEALQDFIEEPQNGEIDASDIISTVCKYYKISSNVIISKKKTKNIVEPRMIAVYLITELLSLPLKTIGQMLGGRDHTTIINARDKIAEEIKKDNRIKIIVADIKNMLLNR